MSNHLHLILKAEFPILSLFMAAVLAEYANYYNYKHHRNGHVFQNRFISECIETERYFWNCLRYVHLNPVKAYIVEEAEKYKYSSMMEYRNSAPDLLHEKAIEFYRKEFGSYSEFEEFHKQRQRELFIDIPDEITSQQNEIALLIAEELFKTKNLSHLTQVFEELSKEYFCFADRGCIVNLANVVGMDENGILLPNNQHITISRANIPEFKTTMLRFWGKQI